MTAKSQPIKRESSPPSTRKPMLTAGGVLRARRQELGLSLDKISEDTKIRKDYLDKIENNSFDSFDSKVFINGFIKNYADYLGLDVNKVTALYRRSIDEDIKKPLSPVNSSKEKKNFNFDWKSLITPRNIIIAIVFLFVVGIIGYISVQFHNFNKAPTLEITSPDATTSTDEDKITITGITEDDVLLFVNDSEININDDNSFEQEVSLVKGSNTITVKAVKKSNAQSETLRILDITYEPPVEEEPEEVKAEEKVPEKFEVTLSTVGTEAWVQLNIDGSQKVAQVLAVGYSETFEVKEEFTIITGRPSATKLTLNGDPIQITIDSATGTASTTCVIEGTGYSCN